MKPGLTFPGNVSEEGGARCKLEGSRGGAESWGRSSRGRDQGNQSFLAFPVFGVCVPQARSCLRTQPRESKVVLRPSGWYMCLSPLKASVPTSTIGWWVQRFTPFTAPKTNLVCKFSCLFNLPLTNPERLPLSSVSPCLLCVQGQFANVHWLQPH